MGDPQADRPADRAGVDLGPQRPIPGSEPPVLVDHEPDAGRIGGLDHRLEIGTHSRGRLLAEDVNPVRAASSTSSRCESGRVQISTKSSSRSLSNKAAASV